MILILTPSEECVNACAGCYYRGRASYRRTGRRISLLEAPVYSKSESISIHQNNSPIRLMSSPGTSYLGSSTTSDIGNYLYVDKSTDDYYTRNVIVATLRTDKYVEVVTVADNIGTLVSMIRSETRAPDMISLSLHSSEPVAEIMKLEGLLGIARCRLITREGDYDREMMSSIIGNPLVTRLDSIYYVMKKGRITTDGKGWFMHDAIVRGYLQSLFELSKMALGKITVTMDECVAGILKNDKGNCTGHWVELNCYGEVRLCPYTSDYDVSYTNGLALPSAIPSCRIMEVANLGT